MNQNLLKVFLVSLIFYYECFSINQKCDQSQTCPLHSKCQSNNYCVCDQDWVFDCSTFSYPINSSQQKFLINSRSTNFTIVPSQSEIVYIFKFNISLDVTSESNKFILTLFLDQGTYEFASAKVIGRIETQLLQESRIVYSPYLEFKSQKNGKMEQIVLEVKAQNFTSSSIIRISVSEIKLVNLRIIWIFALSFVIIVILAMVVGIIYCFYFLHVTRKIKKSSNNCIKHFEQFSPKFSMTAEQKKFIKDDCAICLSQFKVGELVRKLICNHIFHTQCLEKWARKKITCPVCRTSLDKQSISKKLKEKETINKDGSTQFDANNELTENINFEILKDEGNQKQSILQSNWKMKTYLL